MATYYHQDDTNNHPEPHLVNNSITHQRILDDRVEEPDQETTPGVTYQTTETDMMFDLLANSEKMVSEGKEQFYDKLETIKETEESERHETAHSEEDLNEYVDQNSHRENEVFQQRAHAVDPSMFHGAAESHQADTQHSHLPPRSTGESLSPEQEKLMKLDMLRKLGELKQYGVTLSQNYNMRSDLNTMRYEYELHRSIRAKQNWVKWSSNVLLTCVHGLEMVNNKYDPFRLKLKG